jgi:hypothetical protein
MPVRLFFFPSSHTPPPPYLTQTPNSHIPQRRLPNDNLRHLHRRRPLPPDLPPLSSPTMPMVIRALGRPRQRRRHAVFRVRILLVFLAREHACRTLVVQLGGRYVSRDHGVGDAGLCGEGEEAIQGPGCAGGWVEGGVRGGRVVGYLEMGVVWMVDGGK